MDYADNCIKGVYNSEFHEGEQIKPHLYHFKPDEARPDGWTPQSINWQDNDGAITQTLNQEKNGEPQYKSGYAIIQRADLDVIRDRFRFLNIFDYERDKIDGNEYHGNLLLKNEEVKKPRMRQIAGYLALFSVFFPRIEP